MSAEPDEVPKAPRAVPATDALARMFESALDADGAEEPGTCIGPYKLLEEIGVGGFGVVWMAEQIEPIRRRVALKIIKSGMDTREVIARFEAERQALALMDHPNIARVLDAGSTDGGRPFFVMELVRGVAITRFCDEQSLATGARLRLFISVCQAVQHAHQKGVIHRDLKPSNILVTLHDGVPVPKVIDFGIAKATEGGLTDKTLFTHFHAFIGTPAYTSPEQMEMSGLDVDTRSDVYSLGVLLYEMLAGRPPFESESLMSAGIDAMRRTIREVDPPRPSHRLTSLTAQEQTTVARERCTDVSDLSLMLRGDLDWIVMRCLEKDRNRRYETANGLARDIERHLANEPVFARPPSHSYRLRKFIRRHKAAVFTTSAVLSTLVAGLVVSSVLLVRERAARARATEAELAEAGLRRQAEASRDAESKRASLTAIDLSARLFDEGNSADALAYLVHAARMDPANTSLGTRIIDTLASRNFPIPLAPPFECGSRAIAMRYSANGAVLLVATAAGTILEFDSTTGSLLRKTELGKPIRQDGVVFPKRNDHVFAVLFADESLAVYEVGSISPRWPPINLDSKALPADGMWRISSDIKMSPDGGWLSARNLTQQWLWDAATGKVRSESSFDGFSVGLEFSPDNTRFVTAMGDTAQLWSLPACRPIGKPMRMERDPGNSGLVLLPNFSPDGKRLALCDPWQGTAVFDTATGARLGESPAGKSSYSLTIGYLPDGRFFSSGHRGSRVWNLETGESTELPKVTSLLDQIVSSADGKLLLTTSDDGYARIWNTETGSLAAEPACHQTNRYCVALSPDGTQLSFGTSEGAIYRYRLNRRPAAPLILPSDEQKLATWFDPLLPARVLQFGTEGLQSIDVASGMMAALATNTGERPWPDVAQAPDPLRNDAPELSFHPREDMKFIVVQEGRNRRVAWEREGTRFIRHVELEDTGTSRPKVGFVFSRTGDKVAQVVNDNVCVWDLHTGRLAGPPCNFRNRILCVYPGLDISPDGTRVACGVATGEIGIWDVPTGRQLAVVASGSEVASENIRFSPDGNRLLNINWAHEARLWDSFTGSPLSPVLPSADADQCAFSTDGRLFATWGPRSIQFRDSRAGEPTGPPVSFGAGELRFSPDGRVVATFENYDVMRLFESATGRLVAGPWKMSAKQNALFSPDARFVLVQLWENAVEIRSVPPVAESPVPDWLLELASALAGRVIDADERCVDSEESVGRIDKVRLALASLPDTAPLVEWGRWILDDSPARPIAPGFTITPSAAREFELGLASASQ